jgi:hypothetical protein
MSRRGDQEQRETENQVQDVSGKVKVGMWRRLG